MGCSRASRGRACCSQLRSRRRLIPHLHGAKKIEIVDPYIRAPHQLRNLYELLVEINCG
ncbi:hypothetical protein G4X40_14140 [Rhodococcus sp. D2-41]|nr:hypothetical protein [Rhodococcus sp. D2-41]